VEDAEDVAEEDASLPPDAPDAEEAEDVWDASLACICDNNWLREAPAVLPICMFIS
jgi:hypothetical protein